MAGAGTGLQAGGVGNISAQTSAAGFKSVFTHRWVPLIYILLNHISGLPGAFIFEKTKNDMPSGGVTLKTV